MTSSRVDPSGSVVPGVELTLFVSGASNLSARAITNARQLCERHVQNSHLVVIDLNEDPGAAVDRGVLASPTLVRALPLPVRRHVGDLSDVPKVLLALELADASHAAHTPLAAS